MWAADLGVWGSVPIALVFLLRGLRGLSKRHQQVRKGVMRGGCYYATIAGGEGSWPALRLARLESGTCHINV